MGCDRLLEMNWRTATCSSVTLVRGRAMRRNGDPFEMTVEETAGEEAGGAVGFGSVPLHPKHSGRAAKTSHCRIFILSEASGLRRHNSLQISGVVQNSRV